MTVYISSIIEAALLLVVTFLIGCIIGWFFRSRIFVRRKNGDAKTSETGISANPENDATPKIISSDKTKAAAKSQAVSQTVEQAKESEKPEKPGNSGKPDVLKGPRDGGKDDLKKISGIGPKLEGTLNELGIYHFDQIAKWTQAEIDWVDDFLSFKGRIKRDGWIAQAKNLK